MRKTLSFIVMLALVFALSVPAFAQEVSTASTSGSDNIGIKASWGKVTLTSTKSYAYSTTSTYAGKAYRLTARVSGTDKLGSIPASSNSASNAKSTTTGKIFQRSGKVTWKGYGTIQDTKTSGTQSATVTRSY